MTSADRQLPVATLIGFLISATLFAVFFVWGAAVLFLRPVPITPFDPVSAHTTWRIEVATRVGSLHAYSSPEDIRRVEQGLLSLTVTAEDRELDLALVLAVVAFEHGELGSYGKLQAALAATQK